MIDAGLYYTLISCRSVLTMAVKLMRGLRAENRYVAKDRLLAVIILYANRPRPITFKTSEDFSIHHFFSII